MHHLIGQRLPTTPLQATDSEIITPSVQMGWSVFFCYPYTGRPGVPDPLNWDNIPGAHGSTQQARAYSKVYDTFKIQNVKIFGVSLQSPDWQLECANRLDLKFPLLSDVAMKFTNALQLPYFTIEGTDYLERLTMISRDGVIQAVRWPVTLPQNDAAEVIALVQNL
jgi:peroxiredoxin